MKHIQRRGMAVVAAALLLLVGAGGTYAATKSSGTSEREAFLNDVAKRLNVDPKDLTTALREAFSARLDAAVKAGRLTKDQADAIKKRIQSNGGVPFPGGFGGPVGPGGGPGPGGPPGFRGGVPGHGGAFFGGLDAAAKFLGLTEAELRDQIMSGKSLADIAKDKGKSLDDLKAAIKDGVKSKLDDAVKDKRLTQAQEDDILKELDSHLDDLVNGKAGAFPGKPYHGPRGRGVFGGIDGAAKFLGLTEAQLRSQIASGKSLAEIAKDKGKSVDDLKAALKDAAKTKLDAAVKDKHLTQEQADKILDELDSHLDDIVNAKPGTGGKGFRHRWKGGPGGGPPQAPGTYPGAAPAAPATGNGYI
jgi:hypothetical protein